MGTGHRTLPRRTRATDRRARVGPFVVELTNRLAVVPFEMHVKVLLRTIMPIALAVVATFTVSGAIHDAGIFADTRPPPIARRFHLCRFP